MVLAGMKLRIYPNQTQQLQIKLNFGYNRFVWNQMLNMLIKRHENNPQAPLPSAFALNNLLPGLKAEYPWLKSAESTSLQATNHDLIATYQRFFQSRHGFPKFKSRKFPKQSYQSRMGIKLVDERHLKLPKLGIVRFRGCRVTGKIKNVTIRLSATGKFHAILLVDTGIEQLSKTGKKVGIDLGVADLVITSDGIKHPTIRFDKQLSQRKRYWEKRLARRRRQAQQVIAWEKHNHVLVPRELGDFKNYQQAKHMVAKYAEKIANQRQNYLHHITKQLVTQYDVIKMEDLKTKNLLKNHKLARAIANQAWRTLRLYLEYKCAWYGKQLVTVNPRRISQICSNCHYDDGKHPLDIRQWICPNCGINHDRDINAAKNILSA
ncbi:RNA-guided endonuclease TnpB family protein [Lentilactobacillus kisonensis]|uniref:Transposase, IS605 OrfB family n=1 Tax=Lentilactobacillus kisonensis DSM 19906 = JCM 15041 TaxID=1423766 RepID=A0A0R1NWE4_9LACO|nr:RNA-guided endonuclease TnpB family protein [Lentilactobacillus kisonensis]KRL20760.1 transposase, IS605 OrfB family [Lentilactobacillus kisonensis DSM 19906 = JCM 15041]